MAQIGTVRLETQNSGVVDVPVFEPGDSASGIYEFVRVETASGPGFIAVTDPADATYPYLRVQSQNNGIVAVTDTPGSDIPDTQLDHFFWAKTLESVSTWPDEEGSIDLSAVNSPTLGDTINNNQAAVYDGSNYHQASSTGSLGSNGEWAAAGVFKRSSNDTGNSVFFDIGNGSNGYGIATNGTEYVVGVRGVAAYKGGSVDTDPHVFVASYDGSNVILDIDGSEVINTTAIDPSSPTDHITTGARGDGSENLDGSVGAGGHEAAFADATRRDELTNDLADAYGITVST